ncbi:hypothetical protein BGZ98_006327 [Dissophora globulifera]|nr:hypothetical protein BGZ98_006327 [Dissophora globulifera]
MLATPLSGLPNPLRKASVAEYEYQEFSAGSDSVEVRVIPGNDATKGDPFILWDDIQDAFPNAFRLQCGQRAVSFMVDTNGNRLIPLRVGYLPGAIIQVIMCRASSLPAPSSPPPPPPRHLVLSDNDDEEEDEDDDDGSQSDNYDWVTVIPSQELIRRDSLLSNGDLSGEAARKSSIHMYEAFLKAIHDGQIAQANLICNEFREHFSHSQDPQHQILEMQQNMLVLQQQTLDRLAIIHTQVHAILVQNYELHDYPIPRLFIILPKEGGSWDVNNQSPDMFRLHFLCECGDHTKSIQSSKVPHHIHLAKHEGYDIESPAEFFRRYGSYALSLLQMLKYGVSVGGFVVPALSISRETANADSDILHGVNQAIEYLEYLSSIGQLAPLTMGAGQPRNVDQLRTMEGADVRRLRAFLKHDESNKVLGNLYRIVRKEGHVKWVCLDHYRETYSSVIVMDLFDVCSFNRGTFDEVLGCAEVTLISPALANQFYKVLDKAKFVLELKVILKWDVSASDLKTLRDMILRSNIACFDLTCAASSSDILNRSKKSDPLWQIMMAPKMQSFILRDYTGFFSKVSIPAVKNNLRVIKISERVDWKKDGEKLVELLEKCPQMHELCLSSTEVEEAYRAIKQINYDTRMLEKLVLDGGDTNGLQARFEHGVPVAIDFDTSDASSHLLKDLRVLSSLHLRPGLHTRTDIDLKWLAGIISRNAHLTKLIIQCDASDFLRLHIAVKEILNEERSSNLHTLKLYAARNQLTVMNLQGNTSVELELLSMNIGRDVMETLVRVYGSRITRVKIEGDILMQMLRDSVISQGQSLTLKDMEIRGSTLRPSMLHSLRLVLGQCASTLTQLSIMLDLRWDGSEQNCEMADFVVDFASKWTRIMINESETAAWAIALNQRGFITPPGLLCKLQSPKAEGALVHNLWFRGYNS